MTWAAVFVGAVLGVAFGCVGLAIVGMVFVRSQDAFDAAGRRRKGCRRDAGSAGCHGKGSRPSETDRETLLRVFRDTGWIDTETVRRHAR